MKRDVPFITDDGGQLRTIQFPRLTLGVQLGLELPKNYTFEFGLMTNNNGIDVNWLFTPQSLEQGETIIQMPVRLRKKFATAGHKRGISLEAVGGFSYLYNWNNDGYLATTQLDGINFESRYTNQSLKTHIFWLDLGLQARIRLSKRFAFYGTYMYSNAFTPITKTEGYYKIDNQRTDFEIVSRGRAWSTQIGLQYGINVYSSKDPLRPIRNRTKSTLPDSLLTSRQAFKRSYWALSLLSPFFIPQNTGSRGSGTAQLLAAPGGMLGVDYFYSLAPQWSLQAGMRAGLLQYVLRYSAPADSLRLANDFRGSTSTNTATAIFNLGGVYRKFVGKKAYWSSSVGLSFSFFDRDTANYYTLPKEDFRNASLQVFTLSDNAPNPSISPYLKVGYGIMLPNGGLLQWDLWANIGLSKIMNGKYEFLRENKSVVVGSGTFFGRDSFVGIQMSYIFNNIRRQMRKELFK
ncbi:MAG: hypothetical protein MUE85_04365 [Microscillaceae bacterium]|nr:hypothetical protein [Microscillaceae bacterium]